MTKEEQKIESITEARKAAECIAKIAFKTDMTIKEIMAEDDFLNALARQELSELKKE
jgi:hypothetical protein